MEVVGLAAVVVRAGFVRAGDWRHSPVPASCRQGGGSHRAGDGRIPAATIDPSARRRRARVPGGRRCLAVGGASRRTCGCLSSGEGLRLTAGRVGPWGLLLAGAADVGWGPRVGLVGDASASAGRRWPGCSTVLCGLVRRVIAAGAGGCGVVVGGGRSRWVG